MLYALPNYFIMFLFQIHDTYFLVAIIDNDYISSSLFDMFTTLLNTKRTGSVTPIADDADLL
jgi:hypothetical protein